MQFITRIPVLALLTDAHYRGATVSGVAKTGVRYQGMPGSDVIHGLRTSRDKFKAQKSPQGLRRAGSQDFIG